MATGGRALQKPPAAKRKPETVPVQEQIRQRAFEIYLQRGGQDGAELDDWLEAEQDVLGSEPEHTAE